MHERSVVIVAPVTPVRQSRRSFWFPRQTIIFDFLYFLNVFNRNLRYRRSTYSSFIVLQNLKHIRTILIV